MVSVRVIGPGSGDHRRIGVLAVDLQRDNRRGWRHDIDVHDCDRCCVVNAVGWRERDVQGLAHANRKHRAGGRRVDERPRHVGRGVELSTVQRRSIGDRCRIVPREYRRRRRHRQRTGARDGSVACGSGKACPDGRRVGADVLPGFTPDSVATPEELVEADPTGVPFNENVTVWPIMPSPKLVSVADKLVELPYAPLAEETAIWAGSVTVRAKISPPFGPDVVP